MDSTARIGVVGPGAVGGYFGGLLARAGHDVVLLGRPGAESRHLATIRRDGVRIDGLTVRETIPVGTSNDAAALRDRAFVLVSVKSMHTAEAAERIAPHVGEDAVVVALQNGVENVALLRAAGLPARPAVVYVAAAVEGPGRIVHRGRGDLALGDEASDHAFAAICEPAGIPCECTPAIDARLWTKLIINSMGNAISAIAGVPYRAILEVPEVHRLALAVADEAFAVAAADGVELDRERVIADAEAVLRSVGDATSSTEQDLARGRPTEIDALNGFLSRRARALGLPAPTNDALTALVRLRESVVVQGQATTPASRDPSP